MQIINQIREHVAATKDAATAKDLDAARAAKRRRAEDVRLFGIMVRKIDTACGYLAVRRTAIQVADWPRFERDFIDHMDDAIRAYYMWQSQPSSAARNR
jgi:hypothetical protein